MARKARKIPKKRAIKFGFPPHSIVSACQSINPSLFLFIPILGQPILCGDSSWVPWKSTWPLISYLITLSWPAFERPQNVLPELESLWNHPAFAKRLVKAEKRHLIG